MPETKVNEEQGLEELAREMIASKGLAEEDQKQGGALQRELEAQLGEVMDEAILEALPEEKLDELEKMLDDGADDEAVEKIFSESGADYQTAVTEALRRFRAEYLGGTAEAERPKEVMETVVAEEAAVEPGRDPAAAGNAVMGAGTAAETATSVVAGDAAMTVESATQTDAAGVAAEVRANTISTDDNSQNINNTGEPMPTQGTVSEVPGASDVEGVAQMNINLTNDGGAENDAQ